MVQVCFASLKAFQSPQSFDGYNLVLHVLIENYGTSVKITFCSSRTERSEILKSYSHFKIGLHSYYICFCFILTLLFIHTMFP